MANTSSAKKAARQAKSRTAINKSRKSRIHTFIRKVENSIKIKDSKKAKEAFKALEPELMRGVTKGILKLNSASRKLKRLAELIRKIEKPETKKEIEKSVETKKASAKKTQTKTSTKTATKKASTKKTK